MTDCNAVFKAISPSEGDLRQVAKLWNLSNGLQFFRYNENYVYFGRQDDQDVVIRLTHRNHRFKEELVAELDFVNFLAQHDVAVARPYPSNSGALVESVFDDSPYCASVFQKALGASPRLAHEFTPELYTDRLREICS